MVLVLGTNAGFVTVAPTEDPSGGTFFGFDLRAISTKDTSPAVGTKIIEIGWWCDNATEAANFEVGLYTDDVGGDEPQNILAGSSVTNAKGTGAGWKIVTGLNITITENTDYWIGVQLDSTSTTTNVDINISGNKSSYGTTNNLPSDWDTLTSTNNSWLMAIYAKVEAAPSPPTPAVLRARSGWVTREKEEEPIPIPKPANIPVLSLKLRDDMDATLRRIL